MHKPSFVSFVQFVAVPSNLLSNGIPLLETFAEVQIHI